MVVLRELTPEFEVFLGQFEVVLGVRAGPGPEVAKVKVARASLRGKAGGPGADQAVKV